MRRPTKAVVALVLAVAGVAAESALPSRPVALADPLSLGDGQSVEVSAARLDVDVEHGTGTLDGDVTLRVGALEVRCAHVDLRFDKTPRVSWARATGGVAATWSGVEGSAASAELDLPAGTVSLEGSVKIRRGKGWLTAGQATVEVATGRLTLQDVKGSLPVEPPHK